MVFFHFISLSLLLLRTSTAQTRSSLIALGSSLTPTAISTWPSPSALFSFGFFPQNVTSYAVGVSLPDKTVVWTAKRDDPAVPKDVVALDLTIDGRLILRWSLGHDVDLIPTSAPIASASMLDNGNFILYNSSSRIIWQSFDHPTDTLLPGQRLRPGDEILSSASESDHNRGIFRLIMQNDGNLVQYPPNSANPGAYAYWSSDTSGDNNSLHLDSDGRLYMLNGSVLREREICREEEEKQ